MNRVVFETKVYYNLGRGKSFWKEFNIFFKSDIFGHFETLPDGVGGDGIAEGAQPNCARSRAIDEPESSRLCFRPGKRKTLVCNLAGCKQGFLWTE